MVSNINSELRPNSSVVLSVNTIEKLDSPQYLGLVVENKCI